MSWIFGAVDPDGVDPDQVIDAAACPLAELGSAIAISDRGHAVFGAFSQSESTAGLLSETGALVAADARVDAIEERDVGSVEGHEAASAIEEVVRARGTAGLDHVAADFALARLDLQDDTLLLTRDATGNRPLYWGRRGHRIGFASDPRFLVGIGVSDGDIDADSCANFLAGRPVDPRRTGLEGIYRVLGGRWVSLAGAHSTGGRWFRPERDPVDRAVSDEAIDGVRRAIHLSVRDRSRRGRPGLFLSGGRDSGAIAMALSDQGIRTRCFTMTFDPAVCASEDHEARDLAEAAGHHWQPILQSTSIVDDDLRWLLGRTPMPMGYPFATSARRNQNVILEAGVDVLMEGYGGELFVASPLATLDAARGVKPRAFFRTARAFDRRWVYPYASQAKAALRALAPDRLLEVKDRLRPLPPWARPRDLPRLPDPLRASSADDYRLRFLLWEGTNAVRENEDAISFPDGVRTTYPFYDRRVIRAALRIPATDLVPDPEPKWVLSDAVMGGWSRSRVKGDQEPWFQSLARAAWNSHAGTFSRSALIAERGLVAPEGLRPPFERRWVVASSRLVFMEAALQFLARSSETNSGG